MPLGMPLAGGERFPAGGGGGRGGGGGDGGRRRLMLTVDLAPRAGAVVSRPGAPVTGATAAPVPPPRARSRIGAVKAGRRHGGIGRSSGGDGGEATAEPLPPGAGVCARNRCFRSFG